MTITPEIQCVKKNPTIPSRRKIEIANWIEHLKMIPHPEGGYYREIYKSQEFISDQELTTIRYHGKRRLSSSIYFLLPSNEVSRFHRLISDELWYYHHGSPLNIFIIHPSGKLEKIKLGPNWRNGEVLQAIIPRGSIFGSTVIDEGYYSLVGCMVSPGFEFSDFTLFRRDELLRLYPQHADIISRLTIP
ncbi:hypothetical protein SAMN05444392_101195 [Seinonella peptonophila]|uniref:DUF985 domain-containing protein n=1 Tax=Seinonella peptonophila TaxID=112248 RepID=A0A1M4SXR0_9BACL|nr:cupin domain-containing protein [Seinonella peptonophila]SHE37003.1 hypothetical protein SAMN05444392_101195 [Seinonella peptonophila]